jgi:hypothetical protein
MITTLASVDIVRIARASSSSASSSLSLGDLLSVRVTSFDIIVIGARRDQRPMASNSSMSTRSVSRGSSDGDNCRVSNESDELILSRIDTTKITTAVEHAPNIFRTVDSSSSMANERRRKLCFFSRDERVRLFTDAFESIFTFDGLSSRQ